MLVAEEMKNIKGLFVLDWTGSCFSHKHVEPEYALACMIVVLLMRNDFPSVLLASGNSTLYLPVYIFTRK